MTTTELVNRAPARDLFDQPAAQGLFDQASAQINSINMGSLETFLKRELDENIRDQTIKQNVSTYSALGAGVGFVFVGPFAGWLSEAYIAEGLVYAAGKIAEAATTSGGLGLFLGFVVGGPLIGGATHLIASWKSPRASQIIADIRLLAKEACKFEGVGEIESKINGQFKENKNSFFKRRKFKQQLRTAVLNKLCDKLGEMQPRLAKVAQENRQTAALESAALS